MRPNLPDGDSADLVQGSVSSQVPATPAYIAAGQVEICKLLSVVLSAARKRLNAPLSTPRPLTAPDLELAQLITVAADDYGEHLSLSDVYAVASTTTTDIDRVKSYIAQVDDSRRLDDILAKANDLLNREKRNTAFLRVEQEIWLARRADVDSAYYLSARITSYPFFDATPPESIGSSEKY